MLNIQFSYKELDIETFPMHYTYNANTIQGLKYYNNLHIQKYCIENDCYNIVNIMLFVICIFLNCFTIIIIKRALIFFMHSIT